LAPDGKIYHARFGKYSLGVINNPNLIGLSCTYVADGFYLSGRISTFGLPNFYNFNSAPTVDMGNDTIICQGETLLLDATVPTATYLWQDNSTNPTFNAIQQGTYWVEVTTACETSSDTINVTYNPLPILDIGSNVTLCQGETLTLDANTLGATYLWQDNSTTATFNATQQGEYWVKTTVNNCSTTDTININYNTIPTIFIGNDTTICQDNILTLDASTTNATYLWQENSTTPTFNVTQQGEYWVEVTVNNCSKTDTVIINLAECVCKLYFPNSFTPNSDNNNDQFLSIFDCDITEYSFLIYNLLV
jgi:uncharacterized protein Usg